MINSISKELYSINLPFYKGEVSMLPFNLDNISTLPEEFRKVVRDMIRFLSVKKGEAFLTVHGKFVKKDKTLRRGAPHIDGNYLKEVSDWGNGGGNGWKVGENGVKLNSEEHKLSYLNENGGMLIASNYSACKGWNGFYSDEPKEGGDCSHVDLKDGFMLKPDTVYYGNSQFIHESLPVNKDVFRILYRITLPMDYPPLA
jgi:hypothetical protein